MYGLCPTINIMKYLPKQEFILQKQAFRHAAAPKEPSSQRRQLSCFHRTSCTHAERDLAVEFIHTPPCCIRF